MPVCDAKLGNGASMTAFFDGDGTAFDPIGARCSIGREALIASAARADESVADRPARHAGIEGAKRAGNSGAENPRDVVQLAREQLTGERR